MDTGFNPMNCGVSLHQVVTIKKEQHPEQTERLWGDYTRTGLVVGLSEREIKLILPDGEEFIHEVSEQEREAGKYIYSIGPSSEVEYLMAIDKQIEKQKESVEQELEKLKDTLMWKRKFEKQISLLGKLAEFLRLNFK